MYYPSLDVYTDILPSTANTGVVFFGVVLLQILLVNDWLSIYPLCGRFYFLGRTHQVERTNDFIMSLRKDAGNVG